MSEQSQTQETKVPLYWLFVAFVVLLSIGGYVGYELYPRFDLPAAEGIGLFILAVGAGIASFFAPCSFPLLVTVLGRETASTEEGGKKGNTRRALTFAGGLSLGASIFLLLAGLALALGGSAFFSGVTFTSTIGITIRVTVGVLLILLGLVQMGVIHIPLFRKVEKWAQPMIKAQARQRRGNKQFLGFTVYGFGYLIAGFG